MPLHASTSGAARIISSTPKPGSSSPSFSSKSFISFGIVAVGPAGADGRAIDRAIDPVERDLEPARADARLLELAAEGSEQAAGSGGDVLGPADRLGEGQARAEGGCGPARLDGFGQGAQRLVQPGERLVAEATCQRRARQGIEIADAAQSELQEGLQDRRVDPQPLDRQLGECGTLAVRGTEEIGLALGEARQRPGGARGVGHGGAAGEVVAREPLDQVGQQRAFARLVAAEEMGAAAHVEQQAGIAAEAAGAAGFGAFLGDGAAQRIDRHPGRVAVAPVGDRFDQATVGLRVAGCRDQVRHQGARIGQPHMGAQAGGAGVGIDRSEARAAVEPDDGGGGPSRPVAWRRTLSTRIHGRASRSVDSLGNHSETMRFIVPLHEPGRDLGGGGRAEAVASQLDAPACAADVGEAGRRARRRRGDAPARRAHALRGRRLPAQQQGGHAALLGGERQAAAGGRIGRARLAQDGGDAGAAQALFHRPEQILVAPRRDHQQARRVEPGRERRSIRRRIERARRAAAPQQGAGRLRAEAAQQMGGKAQRCAIMGGNATGGSGPRLDLVQGAGQQAAFGQQDIDCRHAQRHGGLACPLDAVGALQPADPFAQVRRDRGGIVGDPGSDRGSKSARGNDGHRPLQKSDGTRWGLNVLLLFYSSHNRESTRVSRGDDRISAIL